jgi:cytochrome c-type biogenesis protein CcmH/NrfG
MPKVNGSTQPAGSTDWTSTQAYVMAIICLLIGVAVGYFVRGSSAPEAATAPAASSSMGATAANGGMPQVTPEQLKHMADQQAKPMLAQLQSKPNDPELLANVGNVYYDTQQYNEAIQYYERSLKVQPTNTSVRTDLGTAWWYLGNADKAVEQFNVALKEDPNKPTTLMNLGVVLWQGKMDANGAIAAWQKLLNSNPNFENRAKVEELMAQARKHSGIQPGTKTNKPSM